jgi:hypothetical protein
MTNRAALSLGLAAILIGLAASPALAATPELGVELERDAAVVSHSDERLDYTVKVKNTTPTGAPAGVGDTLTCVPNSWITVEGKPEFAYQWLRNGEAIGGATTNTYTTSVLDEEKVVQCQLRVTNSVADATDPTDFVGRIATTKGVVVAPQPSTAPPTPPSPIFGPTVEGGGTLSGAESKELKCNAEIWGGAPTSYTYRWFRSGLPYGSPTGPTAATSANVTVPAADQTPPTTFQCTVTATNAGGSVTEASRRSDTSPPPSPESPFNPGVDTNNVEAAPFIATGDYTRGPTTVQLELPGGEETFAYQASGEGWSCEEAPPFGSQHARAICVSSQEVAPGGSFPPLTVIAALGADAPDLAVAKATAFGGGAPAPASAVDEFSFEPFREFGLVDFEASLCATPPGPPSAGVCSKKFGSDEYTQAGGHPFAGVGVFGLTTKRTLTTAGGGATGKVVPIEHAKQIITDLPPGQVGNALAVPELCDGVQSVLKGFVPGGCPPESAVGIIDLSVRGAPSATTPIYAIEPEFGTPAQFAFEEPLENIFTLSTRLRPDDGYAISLDASPPPKVDFEKATATICNFGVDLSGGPVGAPCKEAGEPDPDGPGPLTGANPKPLFTNPTRCGAPAPVTKARLTSWEHPGIEKTFEFTNAEITGCEEVDFEPQIGLHPTSHQADSSTGLDVNLSMPTAGLEEPEGISQANLKKAKITFPEGMAVNPSAGQGLGACSADQVHLETNLPIECPDSSKIGSVEIETPILEETLKGDVYIAKQGAVDGALIGFYLVFDSKKDGILVKVPAKVEPQPNGQLVVTVDDSPEQPFSAVRMHFPGGPRATLLTPPKCGTYQITSELTPWSGNAPVTETSSFEVSEGPGGGPCPNGAFNPKLSAGTENPVAGKTSPFLMRLTREDGSQRFSALNLTTPPGLTAYLKGIPYCPDATLAAISGAAGTGQSQIDSPSCPAQSQIGAVTAGAGAGPEPLFVDTGKAYLAGPYKGAPLSIAVVAPAVAGPLDLGSVVVRNALYLNPETAQVSVKSDPIPTILHGIPLDIRDLRIAINRPNFTLNPTDCEPLAVGADVKGENGASASLSNRFQVGGCDKLAFRPKLGVRLFGGTGRGAHPSLKGTLEAKPGEANIGRAAVTIPRSEFLDQAHIRTICTRVQFAANACPAGAIYGHATATTPLLDYPVEGPVYLRSSNNKLPDLVVDLHGPAYQPIEATVVGRIDSIKGQIRTTFENAPDVPLTKFTLSMQGGKKGLLVNSRDICASTNRATVALEGHNGMGSDTRPAVLNGKCGKAAKKNRGRGGHRR